ncbi:MAG: glutathione S-transferase family protein [Gammaproteobacteria bacterium]|tara:strand:- start:269 stop:1123 length:855 start_codon:yes stop_codon:yes gene_type:complete
MKLDRSDIKTEEILDWKGIHLFHFSGSACSQKLRIFFNIKKINWNSHVINLIKQEQFSEWFLGINPRGLVPTLVHDGDVHIESNEIMAYLDDVYKDNKLFPIDLIDEINKDLAFEDSLHHDLRRLTFRYIIPHALGKKNPSTIDAKEQFEGTIQGKADENKSKEILFWKNHYQNGITDDEIIESANKFKNIYEDFDKTLKNQKYLKGDEFTVVDLAWYVSTKRLAMAGIPIEKYKNVQKWFSNLDNDANFKKEIKIDIPIKVIAAAIKIINKIKRTYVTDLVKF